MHVIINILFYCKLRYIYGLKWITTSKQSSRPIERRWKICSNMKVAKWVEAPTGTFIKLNAKTGKRAGICHCLLGFDCIFINISPVAPLQVDQGVVLIGLCFPWLFCFHVGYALTLTSVLPPKQHCDVYFLSDALGTGGFETTSLDRQFLTSGNPVNDYLCVRD